MTRLFIAEKPSLAREIADALGGSVMRRDGYLEVGNDRVSYCFGHLIEQIKPEEYDPALKTWSIESLPFIPDKWIMRPRAEKNERGQDLKTADGKVKLDAKIVQQIATIKRLVAEASIVVNAGDSDREGQLIVDELLAHIGCRKPVKRLWLQELNAPGIRKAIDRMKDNEAHRTLSESARGRSIADYLIGMNGTRGYTKLWQAAGNDGMLHVGRVQTPTLWLVRRREEEREQFVAVDHFGVKARLEHENGDFDATWAPCEGKPYLDSEGRVVVKAAAEKVRDAVVGKTGKVTGAKTEPKRVAPPLPFTLLDLQKVANKAGLSPTDTLDIVQKLYEVHKIVSYPRTDCPYLPEEDHSSAGAIIAAVKANYGDDWSFPDGHDLSIKSAAFDDSKLGAHYGIVPTVGRKPVASLAPPERFIYQLIVKRYLAQFHRPHAYDSTSIVMEIEGENFKATGKVVTTNGWRVLYESATNADSDDAKLAPLPQMSVGDPVTVQEATVLAKRTEAPPLLDGGSLLDAMKHVHRYVTDPEVKKRLKMVEGLGTEATRASIIQNLIDHKYISEVAKKNAGKRKQVEYVTTEHGRALLQVVHFELSRPDLTAWFEGKLDDIVNGQITLDRFNDMSAKFIRRVVDALKGEDAAQRVPVIQRPDMKQCSSCGKPMSLRTSKKDGSQFWGCRGYPDCKKTEPYEEGKKGSAGKRKRKRKAKEEEPPAGLATA